MEESYYHTCPKSCVSSLQNEQGFHSDGNSFIASVSPHLSDCLHRLRAAECFFSSLSALNLTNHSPVNMYDLSLSVRLSVVGEMRCSYLFIYVRCVRCDKCHSSSYSCLCDVPQGSVFGPLSIFIMYTSPLSRPTLISSLSLNHHLYADDHKFFSLSMHLIFLLISVTFSMLYNTSPLG